MWRLRYIATRFLDQSASALCMMKSGLNWTEQGGILSTQCVMMVFVIIAFSIDFFPMSQQTFTIAKQQTGAIVFNALTDDQFKQAIALFQPPTPTKFTLMQNKEVMSDILKLTAHLEGRMYETRARRVFNDQAITNQFNNVITEQFLSGSQDTFSIDEWYSEIREQFMPPALRNYDPDGLMPAPQHTGLTVDWPGHLRDLELKYPGVLHIFVNSLQLDQELGKAIQSRQNDVLHRWDAEPTPMPQPVDLPTPQINLKSHAYLSLQPSAFGRPH